MLSDVSLSGMTGNDLKLLSEHSLSATVKKKFGSMRFSSSYAPCIASTNLATRAAFMRRYAEVRGAEKALFDEHGITKI